LQARLKRIIFTTIHTAIKNMLLTQCSDHAYLNTTAISKRITQEKSKKTSRVTYYSEVINIKKNV